MLDYLVVYAAASVAGPQEVHVRVVVDTVRKANSFFRQLGD